jgi:hypothetical protein
MLEIPNPNRFTAQSLFEELRERARNEGVQTYEEYSALASELINEKMGYGFFATGDDVVQLQRDLELTWPAFEARLRAKRER